MSTISTMKTKNARRPDRERIKDLRNSVKNLKYLITLYEELSSMEWWEEVCTLHSEVIEEINKKHNTKKEKHLAAPALLQKTKKELKYMRKDLFVLLNSKKIARFLKLQQQLKELDE